MYTVPEPKKTIKNSKGTEMWGPSGAPVWSTPTIDAKRQLLYIGVGQNYSHPANDLSDAVLAVKLSSGEIVWHYQTIKEDVWNAACVTNKVNCPGQYGPDLDIGASVILVNSKDGSDVLLVGQKSGMVYALDPESAGTVLWKKRIGRGGKKGGVHWGMTADSENLYVPIADIPEKINTEHPPQPGIHSVTIKDGQKKWYKPAPPICLSEEFKCYSSYSAAASSAEDMVIVGSMNGAIEIISSYDGELLWSYNTAKEFQTINNIPANGGSIDSDGPILAGKHLVVTSGYDIYGQITGNVLLVFSSEE
jgi:polyvinyl alcohol dehydrogenase (cytochrome)